jgi:tetratricopeptide (TPR) repeat protein
MKKTIMIIMLLSGSIFTKAQDVLHTAFANSYAQESSGNYAGAIHTITVVYSAKSYECNIRLAYLKYLYGAHKESMALYQKAIDLMPYAIEPKLGYVYPAAALGSWDEVVKQYNDILKIDSKNSAVNYKLGVIYYNRKKYSQAYPLFEKVVNMYPFDYDGLLMFAWTNYRMGKLPQAKLLFKKVLLVSPNDQSALEGLALIK